MAQAVAGPARGGRLRVSDIRLDRRPGPSCRGPLPPTSAGPTCGGPALVRLTARLATHRRPSGRTCAGRRQFESPWRRARRRRPAPLRPRCVLVCLRNLKCERPGGRSQPRDARRDTLVCLRSSQAINRSDSITSSCAAQTARGAQAPRGSDGRARRCPAGPQAAAAAAVRLLWEDRPRERAQPSESGTLQRRP